MLPIKSKFKIGKRLGNTIFEQLQTQRFALSEARAAKVKRGRRGGSDYGRQLLEKQRIRFTYGITEGQLRSYADKAMEEKDPSTSLHQALETRLDSVVYRSGLAPTRRAARQAVSHGHFVVNGKRVTVPSFCVGPKDTVTVREGNRASALYANLTDEGKTDRRTPPSWLAVDFPLMTIKLAGTPVYTPAETPLDYATLFEFYSR
jgi:small subunit ribosomal protein S4